MTAGDAYRTAMVLADNGIVDSDAVTHADIDAAADLARAPRPDADDRAVVRLALDALDA
jgi:hypothetical protein